MVWLNLKIINLIHKINKLFCKHNYNIFVKNIYGDEIILSGFKRSVWKCSKCGKLIYKDSLTK